MVRLILRGNDIFRSMLNESVRIAIRKTPQCIAIIAVLAYTGCQDVTEPAESVIDKVVVIISDDHPLKATGAYGNDLIKTPSIDKLANEGVTFNFAFCNSPICSASRQSLLTGKYPYATGVNLLFTPFPDFGNTTIAEHVRSRGIKTAVIGKRHWNNWAWEDIYSEGIPDHGFDLIIDKPEYREFMRLQKKADPDPSIEVYNRDSASITIAEWMNWRVLPHPVLEEFSEGTFFANQAIEFIQSNQDSSFFLWLSFYQPHHPYYFPVEYNNMYDPDKIVLPSGSQEDDRWIPEKFKKLTEDEKRGIIASFYTSMTYLDNNVGRVLTAIENLDMEEEILVIYLSDNGYLLNDHKRFEKHTMWEESLQQPTIFKVPGKGSKRINKLVEYVDIVPTIIELLGLDPLEEAQGQSFAGLIDNPEEDHKDYVFATYLEDNMAMLRTERWKYVFSTGSRDLGIGYKTGLGPSGILHRLYDLHADPMESTNLASRPEYKEQMSQLQSLMISHFEKTHPDGDVCPSELGKVGKLVWFCEPRDVGTDQSLIDTPVRVFDN